MKKLNHDKLSNVSCEGYKKSCDKKIKQRLRDKENPNELCYSCYCKKEADRGHTINTFARGKRIKAGLPVKSDLEKNNRN